MAYRSLHCQNPVVQSGQNGAWPVASAYAAWSWPQGEAACGGESAVVATQMSACSTTACDQNDPDLLNSIAPVEGRFERKAYPSDEC